VKHIPQGSCPTCDVLWRKYAHATAEHIKLLAESQVVVIKRDTASDEKLTVEIAEAGQRRESARSEIRKHEVAAHGENESGANAGS
jgi:hypothetical protein